MQVNYCFKFNKLYSSNTGFALEDWKSMTEVMPQFGIRKSIVCQITLRQGNNVKRTSRSGMSHLDLYWTSRMGNR